MQRWFFLEDPENATLRAGISEDLQLHATKSMSKFPLRRWLFRVEATYLKKDEIVCVSGSVPELGLWELEQCISLNQEQNSNIWSQTITIPDKIGIRYRFCVCVNTGISNQVIIRSWEAQVKPRQINPTEKSPKDSDKPLIYGECRNEGRIDRGWLTTETVVHLKFYNNPLKLCRPKYSNRTVYIKVTPIELRHDISTPKTILEVMEITPDAFQTPKYVISEVASLNGKEPKFHPQPQFGEKYKQHDMLIFQFYLLSIENLVFLIDLYIYSSKHDNGEPPYHAGFSYILPNVLQSSEGSVVLPVTSTKHRPLGQISFDYIIVKPLPNYKCNLEVSYTRYWKNFDIDIAPKESSFKNQICVRENTPASLKNPIDNGVDYVEFNVQLSQDLDPVFYNNFNLCILKTKKKNLTLEDLLEIPVNELTLDQLQMLKVYHLTEFKIKNLRYYREDPKEYQPFPTLKYVLQVLNPKAGFNIEIQWPMQLYDGSYKSYQLSDLNQYLDAILNIVLLYGGERKIIFSSFNPDICFSIRLKQNKYPVMFSTIGESTIYGQYRDPRCWSIPTAIRYANMIELLGINAYSEDLVKDPSIIYMVNKANLVMFCWGNEFINQETLRVLKDFGLHSIIYNKTHQITTKEIRESIFFTESNELQKDFIKIAAKIKELPKAPPVSLTQNQVIDIEEAQEYAEENVSTATSLESLQSQISDYNKNDAD